MRLAILIILGILFVAALENPAPARYTGPQGQSQAP